MRCTIWYRLHNSKNVKDTHGGVLLLAKLQALDCNLTKSKNPPWVFFFTFFKLYRCYQIAQSVSYVNESASGQSNGQLTINVSITTVTINVSIQKLVN